jgi:hypothetical protein
VRERIIGVVDKRAEEESVMNNVIEATSGNGSLATPGGGEGSAGAG